MRNPIDLAVRWYQRALGRVRARYAVFDHFWRAKERYDAVMGGRLAAAIAYYAFFAAFALAFVAYSILGFALGMNSDLKGTVDEYLDTHLPQLTVERIQQPHRTFAVLGFVGLVLTGVGWVEALRSAQRLVWGLEEQPGDWWLRRLVDLGMLAGLGLLLALSLWIVGGIERLLGPAVHGALGWLGTALGWLVNLVLAAALLAAVPRLRMPLRRLLPSALLVAVGITVLTTAGQAIIRRTEHNPAYQFASSVAGLLLFLYLFNQLLLYGAALAATSPHGRVRDLATQALVVPSSGFGPEQGDRAR